MNREQLSGQPKVEVRVTADGSATLFVPALNEHYHSQHGARQESAHVFIRHGLVPLLGAAADPSKYGFDVVYHVHNQVGKEVARAKTGMLCFDYNTHKLRLLPAELAAQVGYSPVR